MVRVHPSEENGLTQISEVNTAQLMTIQKDRLLTRIGLLRGAEMKTVEDKLAYMLNLAAYTPSP